MNIVSKLCFKQEVTTEEIIQATQETFVVVDGSSLMFGLFNQDFDWLGTL